MSQEFNIVGNLLLKVDGAEAGLNKLKSSLSKLKMPEGLENSFKKSFSNLDTILARYKSQIEKGFDTKADVTAFTKTGKALDAELNRISKHFTELTGKEINFRVNSNEIIQTEKELQKLIEQKEQIGRDSLKFNIEGAKDSYKDIEALLNKLKEVGEKTKTGEYASNALDFLKAGNIQGAVAQLDKAAASCKRFGEEKQKAFQATGFDISTAIQLMIQQLTGATGKIGEVNNAISGTQDKLNNLRAEQVEKAGNYAEKLSNDFNKSNTAIRQADGAMQDFARSSQSMAEQVKQLQQSTQYFFGLRNMLNLFKRGIREAVDTVKQLDKAMTETAVVTKFSVGDMWAKLPEYTANANALGATVQDMYEATTLYYQQGLNSQQAMEIAGETMKMARIGGLEAAAATDMMTAALRGFNMELNETSAQRINDVYSNLAAKTASNTQELGTAMQRTASIAASAGMSFEGTAAFLAQAIETTREPAENLGTAMKTIVARFTELKKNPLEITDVDGEEVSYNKVDTALQSIGVSLKDTNGQFRDLDQVFLDISQRWDSLSQTQQRYIATTAAGSRQQSRFIAMMSNYERTTQLMEYANNANGASNEQFGKTLDSLEAKLNKFQNAWKEFLMGIMNDSWTKGLVDAGTTVLGIVNKLIDVLSFGGKAKGIQSFLSLFLAFKGLKFAGRGANALIGGLAGSLDPNSSFGQGFKNGALGGAKTEISQATNRIVQAIYGLVPHIDKNTTAAAANQYRFQEFGQYNQARKELINNLGGHLGQAKKGQGNYTAGSLLDIINTNKLNKQQQKQFFQASPGLKRNLTKSLTNLYKEVGTDKKTTEALISGFKNGDLGLEEALLGNNKLSTSFSEAYKKLSEQGNRQAATELLTKHTNELLQTGKNQGLQGKELQNFVAQNLPDKRVLNQAGLNFLQNPQVLTTSEKFANVAGQIGAGFMSAGSAIQMFGAQVSQINPIIGQAISNFGGLLTTVGSLANVIPTIVAGGPVAWGIAAAVTAIGGLTIGLKAHADSVKKKGQEIVDTYTDTSNELKNSIDSIKGYQSELSRLSTGVDENGFNINLDDSEYQRYLELVDDLVHQNPAVVEGWNSEGKAIINVNKALKDTIKLKQQDLAAEKEKYLSDTSGQQLINARNATMEYKKATSANSNLVSSASSIVGDIIGAGLEKEAKAAGFDLDKIRQGDLQAINFLRDHYTLLESVYKNGGQEISTSLADQIGEISDTLGAYEEAITPVVDYLTEYANTENLFADLPAELTSAFNDGLKSIAGKDLEVGEMKKAANYLSSELRNAFNESKDLLDDADEALNHFSQDLNETAYNKEATRIADEFRVLKANAEAVGQVEIAQWYENQASRIENALTNSVESISSYVDTLSDNITNAKASFDALGEGIEDYYSLADQAHGLVETALQDKNTEGNGSKTFWNTYRGLASEDAYNQHDREKAIADMKQFQKYFTEGAEGSRVFAQKLIDWQTKEFEFTEKNGKTRVATLDEFFKQAKDGTMGVTEAFTDLTDEQYAQIASVFDLSADGFTAILNKLRQFGDLNFSDPKGIRRALAFDDRTIKTDKEVKVKGEEPVNRLYYGQSMLETEMADETPEVQQQIVEDLNVRGSIQLPSGADNLIKKGLGKTDDGSLLKQFVTDTKGTGNQIGNVLQALYQSGEYTKDDLKQIHSAITTDEQYGLTNASDINTDFETMYKGFETLADPTKEANDHLNHIGSAVDTIASVVAAGKVGEGYLPEVAKQSGALRNEIIGGAGFDTWIQRFSRNLDENGNAITDKARYNEIYAKLDEYKTANDNYINELKEGRAAAEERGASVAELQAFDDEIAAAEENSKLIAQYMQNAADNWKRLQTDFYNASQTVFKNFADIRNNENLSQTEKQTETATALTDFAKQLEGLNFSPEAIAGVFKDNFGIELDLKGGEFATDLSEQINEKIKNLDEAEINAVLNIASIKMPGAAKGKNNTPSAIRRVGTMARGSKRGYTINGRPTLTGELGPELVWEPRQNSAYMVGEHGPQFANLSKNAVVWNAQQTKKIKKNSKGVSSLGTGAHGIHSFGTMADGNVGGTKIPGTLEVDANANILEVIPPTPEPEIPVKAKLEVEGASGGNVLSRLFGGNKQGPSINVAANVTSINPNEQLQTIKVIGNITKLNTENTVNDVKATAVVTEVTKSAQVSGEPIIVRATAITTSVKNETPVKKPQVEGQTIKVGADTSAAQSKINQLIRLFNKTYILKYKASGPSSISVPISANFTGSWKKTVEITKSGAKGINNHIANYSRPSFGSAAKGHYGTIGPNNKGGLTLTGEKGFEIAWLPSENRSMILGVNGPQMLNLPKDAVVFTNEQSKKILKQKAVPAGSHGNNSVQGNDIFAALGMNNSGGGRDTTVQDTVKDTSSKINKTIQDTSSTIATEAQKTATKLVKVSVWWENIARKTEATQRAMDSAQKQFENYLKKMTATLDEVTSEEGGNSNAYIQKITEYIGYNQAQVNQAEKEFKILATNPKAEKTKAQKKADKAVKDAKKTKDKEDDKEAKKKQKKANYNAGAAVQVTYEKMVAKKKNGKVVKDKNGKTVKEKKTVTSIVNTAPYVKTDGTIDADKLRGIKNKNKRKAVADALNQEINDKLNKKYKAEDAIAKAQEALDKIGQDIYETFFNWKSELSEVWVITQKIAQLEQEISKNKTIASLYDAQLASGKATADEDFNQKVIDNFTKTVENQALQVQREGDLASAAYNELNNKLALTEETAQAQRLTNELNSTTDLGKQLGISEALQKLSEEVTAKSQVTNYANITQRSDGTVDIDFDREALYRDRDAGKLTGDAAKVIEDYVNDLIETSGQISEHVEKQISVGAELYNTLASLKEEQAQNAEQLVQITKENNSKELDKLKKLNDSITKALKELLDGVKKKLDERRTQENNAKTERDISQKQQRLAALRADTSGGHQVEIAQLEKEISEAQTNYQQSLEDQLVDRLQTQADEAAAQRERQIELQEALIESTNNIAKVNMWMTDPEHHEEEIKEAYRQANNYDNVTDVQRTVIDSKAEQFWSSIKTNHEKQVKANEQIENIKSIVDNAVTEGVKGITPPNTVEQIREAGAAAAQTIADAATTAQTTVVTNTTSDQYQSFLTTAKSINGTQFAQMVSWGNQLGKDPAHVALDLANTNALKWKDILPAAKAAGYNKDDVLPWFNLLKTDGGKNSFNKAYNTYYNIPKDKRRQTNYPETKASKKKYEVYKTGGLADYTGPAWLDGTPSKPELVLNAQDTQNFIALRDVLSKALGSTNSVSNSYAGDVMYEININVDKIEKDYDVDKVVEKVKKEIVKGAGYRNVTQVRNFK